MAVFLGGVVKALRLSVGFIAVLLVLCAVAVASFRYWDSFRDHLLLMALQPMGVSLIETRIRSLSFSEGSVELESLRLDYQQAAFAVAGNLTDLRVQHTLPSASWVDPLSWSLVVGTADLRMAALAPATAQSVNTKPFNPQSLLPQSFLSQVPLAHINIQNLRFAYQPRQGEPWLLEGNAMADSSAITAAFSLSQNAQVFSGNLKIQPDLIALALGQGQQVWIKVDSRLSLVGDRLVAGGSLMISDLNHTEDWLDLLPFTLPETRQWRGRLKGAYSLSLPREKLQAWLDTKAADLQGVLLTLQLQPDIEFVLMDEPVESIHAAGSANIQLADGKLSINALRLDKVKALVRAEQAKLDKLVTPLLGGTDTFEVELTGDYTGHLILASNRLQVNSEQASVFLRRPGSGKASALRLQTLGMTMAEGIVKQLDAVARFKLAFKEQPALNGLFNGKLVESDAAYTADAVVTLDDLTRINATASYKPESQWVDFKLASERANLATDTFNEWTKNLAMPITLELGDFSMSVEGRLNIADPTAMSAQGSMLVADWEGNLDKNHFKSLSSPFSFSGNANQFVIEGKVSNGLFDIGIPITDTRYNLRIESDIANDHHQITVSNLESKLVGGLVRIPEIHWDNKIQQTEFNVVIFNWQFSEIIELLQRDDLEVSGVLDGMLPVRVLQSGIEIKDGLLTARHPGGVIRYLPDTDMKAYLEQQGQLKMAVDILENFHYSKLDVVLNQQVDGNQLLNLTLKGKNPQAYGGTPVNLNLNVEHNINPLLQSLTLPGKIQEHWDSLEQIQ